MIPNCAAARHTHFKLDGTGPAKLTPPNIDEWPNISLEAGGDVKRVFLDGITKEEIPFVWERFYRASMPSQCGAAGEDERPASRSAAGSAPATSGSPQDRPGMG